MPNDKAGAQKAAKTEPEKKFRFWPWSQQETTQNNDMLSDQPVATVLMDGAHLSEEKPMTENDMPEMTGEEAAMKLDVMNPEKPDLMHPEMTEDDETEALPVDNKN
ncbi:GL14469 [Drosophila persimilis]|uniref:GL14469 n=1 Tax=Drosophila persimilis TaxID=7234 RepID=B4GQD0_DROPE|nr:GL14469 [Drosophila persimilis]